MKNRLLHILLFIGTFTVTQGQFTPPTSGNSAVSKDPSDNTVSETIVFDGDITLPPTVSGGLSSFATAAQGSLADTAVQPDSTYNIGGIVSIGVGGSVDFTSGDFIAPIRLENSRLASTPSDYAVNASAWRTELGLGNLATMNSNAFDDDLLPGDLWDIGSTAAPWQGGFFETLEVDVIDFTGSVDTTLTRSAAGVLAVEGVDVLTTATGYTQSAADAAFEPAGVTAADITDATATGQAAITAADPAALRDAAGIIDPIDLSVDVFDLFTGTTVLDADFSTDADGFSAGTRQSGEGNDLTAGFLRVPSNATATVTWTPQTSGIVVVSFAVRAEDTETAADALKNTTIVFGDADLTTSASSAGSFTLNRDTNNNATSSLVTIVTRSGGVFLNQTSQRRSGWHHWAFAIDMSARTYDVYYEGMLWSRGLTCPDTTFTEVSKMNISNLAGSPALDIDSVRVIGAAKPTSGGLTIYDDFRVGSGAVGGSQPVVDQRLLQRNTWLTPSHPSLSGYARGANGAASGDGIRFNVITSGAQGTWRMRWKVPDTGDAYAGLAFNCYEVNGSGLGTEDAFYLLRYLSTGGASALNLFKGVTSLASSSGTTGGVSYGAGTEHEFRVERRGRYLWAYVDGVLQLGPIKDSSNVRGLLGEEGFGPITVGTLGAATILSVSHTGPRPRIYASHRHGNFTSVSNSGQVREMYVSGSKNNLFFGKGIQTAHRGTSEPAISYAMQRTDLLSADNVNVERQRGLFAREDQTNGIAETYTTKTRRGVYVADLAELWGTEINWGPDLDLRPEIWSGSSAYAYDEEGNAVEIDWSTNHNWTSRHTADVPIAFQALGTLADGRTVRLTAAYRDNNNIPSGLGMSTKYKGNGDGLSLFVGIQSPAETDYELGITYVLEVGSGLTIDNNVANGLRVHHDTVPTYASGTNKTDVDGDEDSDGYNERRGWLEVAANSSGGFSGSYTLSTLKLPRPQWRIHGWAGATLVLVDGEVDPNAAVDDLGDGTAILTLGATLTGNAVVELL